MIILVHMLLGAAIGSKIDNIYLAIFLAILSHYILDFIPHIEYPIKDPKEKYWKKTLKVGLDIIAGLLLIFIFSPSTGSRQAKIYLFAIVSAAPDSLTLLGFFVKNKFLEANNKFNRKVHFLEEHPSTSSGQEKISMFWRISSQVIVAALCIYFLKS